MRKDLLQVGPKYVKINMLVYFYRIFGKRHFDFWQQRYRYLYHYYNETYRNARAVEVPIFTDILERSRDKRTLEIGNVMHHYIKHGHDVVDLYEVYPGVVNADAAWYRPEQKYDLVITISTLEHIGWDEYPIYPEKASLTVQNILDNMLNPDGRLVLSIPMGWNRALERDIALGNIKFNRAGCLEQRDGEWRELSLAEALAQFDDKPMRQGRLPQVLIGEIIKT